jgi:hypothetical protein
VHIVIGSGRTTLLRARERQHRLGDEAGVVDGIINSGRGRWRQVRVSTVERNDDAETLGRTRQWCGDSMEDSMMARALRRSTMAQALGKFLVGKPLGIRVYEDCTMAYL